MARAYRHSTRALGAILFLLGLTMMAVTIARGGGGLAIGVVVGALLALLGAGRVALTLGARDDRETA